MNGGMKIASWQSGERTEREGSGYSIERGQVINGIIRKEMKQIECVQQRKKNG
jgi:hypothetical protein